MRDIDILAANDEYLLRRYEMEQEELEAAERERERLAEEAAERERERRLEVLDRIMSQLPEVMSPSEYSRELEPT